MQQAAIFKKNKNLDKVGVCHLLSTQWLTDRASEYLVNNVERLAIKGPNIYLRSWWKTSDVQEHNSRGKIATCLLDVLTVFVNMYNIMLEYAAIKGKLGLFTQI